MPQPRLPDVSGVYRAQGQLGEELSSSLDELGRVLQARQVARQKARDVATLTEFETGFSEAVALKAIEIKNDQRIHPDDYHKLLSGYREQLFKERSPSLGDRLMGTGKAKVYNATEKTMIGIAADGAEQSVKRYMTALETFEGQIESQLMVETDPAQYDLLATRVREKYLEYVEGGILSKEGAMARSTAFQHKLLDNAVEQRIFENAGQELKRLQSGEYPMLSAESRNKLTKQAQTERKAQAEWQNSLDLKAEKDLKKLQSIKSGEATSLIVSGKMSLGTLNAWRERGEIDETDYRTNVNMLLAKQAHDRSQAESRARQADMQQERNDKNALGRIKAQVAAGEIDPTQVIDAAASGKWSGQVSGVAADWASQQVRQSRDDTKSELRARHAQGLQEAEAALEQSGLRPRQSQEIDALYEQFRVEYRESSPAWSDNPDVASQDPLKVKDALMERYLVKGQDVLKKRGDVLLNLLPQAYKPTEQAGIEASIARLQQDKASGLIDEGKWRAEMRRLRELEGLGLFPTAKAGSAAPTEAATPAAPAQKGWLDTITSPFKREEGR